MGKYEEAEFHYKESLRINPEGASAYANLGILYFTTGDLECAVQWLRKASRLFEREGKRIDSIRMNGLADWALARKYWENFSSSKKETYRNLEESRKYYLEAAAKFEDMGVPELYPFFEFLSKAIFIGKDFLLSLDSENLKELQIRVTDVYTQDEALKNLEEALNINREIGYRQGEARDLGNIGLICWDKGDLDEALKNFKVALNINREIGYKQGEARDLGNIGLIYRDKGDSDEALKNLKAALNILDTHGLTHGRNIICRAIDSIMKNK
jgi:tetratricopeptide (TPR) repeat protein